jgi:hypothetical protein
MVLAGVGMTPPDIRLALLQMAYVERKPGLWVKPVGYHLFAYVEERAEWSNHLWTARGHFVYERHTWGVAEDGMPVEMFPPEEPGIAILWLRYQEAWAPTNVPTAEGYPESSLIVDL